jgi:hypothetical protein
VMIGSASLTTIVIVVVSLPPLLVAVIVYTVELVIAVGVPLMSPVEVLREIPAGSEGDMAQDTT